MAATISRRMLPAINNGDDDSFIITKANKREAKTKGKKKASAPKISPKTEDEQGQLFELQMFHLDLAFHIQPLILNQTTFV